MYGPPRLVPGRGRYAGQVFLLHGCFSDGPYTWPQANAALAEIRRNPVSDAVYADFERRGLGGMATHFLTDDLTDIDMDKINAALAKSKVER